MKLREFLEWIGDLFWGIILELESGDWFLMVAIFVFAFGLVGVATMIAAVWDWYIG